MGFLYLGSVLDFAGSGEQAIAQRKIGAGDQRFEIVEGNLFQRQAGVESGIWSREEIGLAVDDSATGTKDGRLQVERGGVDLIRQTDVTDIFRFQVQAAQIERLFRVLIDIGDSGVMYRQDVDLKGINRLYRLLPPLLLERYRIGGFAFQLSLVDPDFRPVELEFGDEFAEEDIMPVNACMKNREIGNGRIRMGILGTVNPFRVIENPTS